MILKSGLQKSTVLGVNMYAPKFTIDPIVESVRGKLFMRSQVGILKYGTTLERPDLTTRDWLVHAQEEAMDLANYLEVLIQEYDKNKETNG